LYRYGQVDPPSVDLETHITEYEPDTTVPPL